MNSDLAKYLSYTFLSLATASWLAAISYKVYNRDTISMSMAPPSGKSTLEVNTIMQRLIYFCVICIVLSVIFGGIKLGSDVSKPRNIMNLISIACSLVLVILNEYHDWGVLSLSLATLTGLLSAAEMVADE